MEIPASAAARPTSATGRSFVLAPFRGLRYNVAQEADLGAVVSPPYDVLDAETVRRLEEANHHNIVRLILSRRFERPYLAVLHRLEQWRDADILAPDPEPTLYVYEYTDQGVTVRGLIGLAALRDEPEGVILPHEDVMPAPVDDRAVLMRTTRTNLEPILLAHEGSARLRSLVGLATATEPCLAQFRAADESSHRLWGVTDPDLLDRIATELAPARVLIADGHHRYAAYQRLQAELRDPDAPDGGSPWDFGLAMLVDQHDFPMRIGPIHRSVSALTMADVRDLTQERGDTLEVAQDRAEALARLEDGSERTGTSTFVISDGRCWGVLRTPRTHHLNVSVLHETLLPAWHIAEEQVGYHHSIDQALDSVARRPGLVIGVTPPTLPEVMAAAAQRIRMPRKSTSFAPKPRMGLVLRDLREELG